MAQYTQTQIDKVLEKLPEGLKEALFSVETADAIWQACTKHNIQDERMSEIAEHAGYVLMGLLLPSEFIQMLHKEIKLPQKVAEELGREINRFVFYPVKPELEQLHKVKIGVAAKAVTPKPLEKEQESSQEPSGAQPRKDDPYQESLG